MKFKDKLVKIGACKEAVEWVNGHGFKKSWATCERGDWMLWYVFRERERLGLEDMRLITLAKALTVKLINPLLKDKRNIRALKGAEDFGRGKATRKQLDAAYAAAYAYASDASDAAAYAADAAYAYAYAYAYAADASDAAAYASYASDARKDILSKSADICREVFKDVKF